jgi:indolepyruvate ferredoxin oxidoreductase alpha subunit
MVKTLLVFEEVEPIVEEQIKVIAFDSGKRCTVKGKLTGDVQREGDLNVDVVAASIAKAVGIKYEPLAPERRAIIEEASRVTPTRKLTMCLGCPTLPRSSYFTKQGVKLRRGGLSTRGTSGAML